MMKIHGSQAAKGVKGLVLAQLPLTEDQREEVLENEFWVENADILHLCLNASHLEFNDDEIKPTRSGFLVPESTSEITVLGVAVGTIKIPAANHVFSGLTISGKPESVVWIR